MHCIRQGGRVGAVVAGSIGRDFSGCGSVRDQGALRSVHPRQAAARRPEAAREGIVAAGIDNHEVQAIARVFQRRQ